MGWLCVTTDRPSLKIRLLTAGICVLLALGCGYRPFLPQANAASPSPPRRVNAPYLSGDLNWGRAAVFWLGQNEQGDPPTRNYADVRVGYTDDALEVRATIADYYLWYDDNADSSSDLTQFDAVALYLDTAYDRAAAPQSDDYRFLIGSLFAQEIDDYMRQARGEGSAWDTSWTPPVDWTALSVMSWSCNPGPNDNSCGLDYGWTAIFTIPWETLGLSSRPADGTIWGLGVQLYDRDDEPLNGGVSTEHWPESLFHNGPSTWGELAFSPQAYRPPSVPVEGETTIRRATDTDTSVVQDAWVGGGGWCGGGHEGGADENHGGFNPDGSVKETELFAGSEVAVTHLPCFSKSFLRFYLDAVPAGKTILSATLTLHHWGNSGDPNASNDADHPHDSYVWLYSISDSWTETGITWNNAPLVQENLDMVRVIPLTSHPGWPGIAYTWDATAAVTAAYDAGTPVSLAIYDSANERNTSKYFTSSETGDWNVEGRPLLTVLWGQESQLTKTAEAVPAPSDRLVGLGDTITYTLGVLGSNQTLTVTDVLPVGISHPSEYAASYGTISYNPATRRLTWGGAPGMAQPVTITYEVTVTQSGTYAIVNTARMSAENGSVSTASSTVIVEPKQVFLPCVLRQR